MSYIAKPKVAHPKMPRNNLGLTARDYEGTVSTLCAGCGHDSVTAAIVQAVFELNIEPHMLAKMSGIGCSSKTPAYFVSGAHGFNSVHGRMPSVTTGANAANRELTYIGVSGDGDSLSIGVGQFVHAIRRNVNMCYIIENNGVYGLTKGQFSASADVGSKAKKGEVNEQQPIDPVITALGLGGTFIARGFSGDKEQLIPLIKAGLNHDGFALLDVLSPCVTFNDHEDSTKSYAHTRQNFHRAIRLDFIPPAEPISTSYVDGETRSVRLHDGSHVLLRKTDQDYDPTDRSRAFGYIDEHQKRGEVVTGLLYIDADRADMHTLAHTVDEDLINIPFEDLCPGADALAEIQNRFR
jgi:2-oxoglutarate ferredoxin oxidoreductase subunit beta